MRQQRRLRQELGADHVVRELDLVVQRALADDHAVGLVGERGDQRLHERDVGGAEAAEAEVDERLVAAGQRVGQLEGRVARAHAGVEAVPRAVERPLPLVVELRRIEVEVEVGRGVHEIEIAQRRGPGLAAERVERPVQVGAEPAVLGLERAPLAAVGRRIAREDGRHGRIAQLGRVARERAHPARAAREDGGEGDDVVLDDHVGLDLGEDLAQARLDVDRAVAERLEGRHDEVLDRVDRGAAEDGRRLADVVLPELPRHLLDLRRRAEAHEALLEAARLERAGERLLDHEDHASAARAQHVAHADAVVGRAERPLGEEHDRRLLGAHASTSSRGTGGQATAPTLAWSTADRR